MPKSSDQEKAEKLYVEGGSTYATLAKRFKVSERTIKRWAEAGNWQTKKKIQEVASQAIAEEVSEELAKPISAKSVRAAMQGMSRKEFFHAAKSSLYANAPDAEIKSQEAAYGQLIKIMQIEQQMQHQERMADLEYKLKEADLQLKQRQLTPPTPKEWAAGAFNLGIDPVGIVEEVIRLLREAGGVT